MANVYEGMNVVQKLAKARLYFLNSKVSKSGINTNLEFKYFELEDIVPTAIRIFARIGLVGVPQMYGDRAVMYIYNADNAEEKPLEFVLPFKEMPQIVSKQGREVTNPLQALGSSVTYIRRYLWMIVLDITEPDDVDATLTDPVEEQNEFAEEQETAKKTKKEKKSTKPATAEERKEAKEELTKSQTDSATEDQITALKELCSNLMAVDEDQEEFVTEIALKTDGFTNLTAEVCTKLSESIIEMLAQYPED